MILVRLGGASGLLFGREKLCAPSSSLDAKPGRPLTCPPIRSPPAAAKFKSSRFCFPIMWWSERTGRGSRLLMGPIHDRVEPRVNISVRFLEPPCQILPRGASFLAHVLLLTARVPFGPLHCRTRLHIRPLPTRLQLTPLSYFPLLPSSASGSVDHVI